MLNRFFVAIILCMASISCVLAQTTVTYTTTADGSKRLEQKTGTTKTSGTNVITIKDERYQDIDGFGYAITYSAAYNLLKMDQTQRTQLLTNIFSKTRGYGVNYIRMSIGCSDFSSTEYTYCDVKGPDHNLLQYFKLHSDERDYVLPVLREIKAINPDIKIMAAPWTCPRWMKVNNINDKAPYNSWTDGRLNPDYRQAYANYFVKFIKAMHDEGFNIYAVTPQNEPLNGANCASLVMPWQEEADFVKVLAKTFHENSIKTRIYLFDHNFNYDENKYDGNKYSEKIFQNLGTGYAGEDLVVGTAWHDYGGDPSEMTNVHNQYPNKEQIFTEESIGEWNDGRNVEGTLVGKMKRTGISFMQNWSRAVMVWNLMLDDHKAPNLSGGCQTCYGAVDIDRYSYSHLVYNNQYYVINHLASVIDPGAYRVSTDGWYAENMDYLAFRNPDGTCAMIFASSNAADQNFSITDGNGNYMDVTVPANGIVSVKFGAFTPAQIQQVEESADPGIWIIGAHSSVDPTQYQDGDDNWLTNHAIKMEQINDHTYEYTFEVGKTLNPGYVNFKFFGQAGWGIEYKPGSEYSISTDSDVFGVNVSDGNIYKKVNENLVWGDKYTFTIDASNPNALKLDVKRIPYCPYNEIMIFGANNSIGSMDSWEADSWDWNSVLPMTAVDRLHYSYTFTVGENLNKNRVNFKFFANPDWKPFEIKDGFNITTTSGIFGIGNGSDGHDNGNIYLKAGQTLNDGEKYRFDLDVTNPNNVNLTVTKEATRPYTDIYVIGDGQSVGDYQNGTGDWNPDRNFKLDKLSDTHYRYTFVVGNNLNPNNVNFKFFGQAGWGIEFTSNSTYKITTNSDIFYIGTGSNNDNGNIMLRRGKTLSVGECYIFDIDATDAYNVNLTITKQPDHPYSDIYIIGATNSVGDYIASTSTEWEPTNNYKLDKISDYQHKYTFTVGENLNPNNVNFKFFGQAGWGFEFTSNGIYRISTTSDIFGIGTGNDVHDNGNIYLRSGKTLTPGDKYIFTINASNAYNVVLSIEHQPAQGNQEQIVMTNTQGTYSNANALSFPADPDADIKAYIIKNCNDSYAFLTRINDVPANTGLFIRAKSAGTYMVSRATNAPTVSGNLLEATVSATAIQPTDNGSTNYYFSTTSQSFVRLAKEVTMPANRAYLQLPGQSGAKPLTLVFDEFDDEDDIVTGITEVRDSATIVYDLNGRRLSTSLNGLPAGIYIVNGKKVSVVRGK